MSTQNEIKKKLKLIGQGDVQRVILDVLSLADSEITGDDRRSPEDYARAFTRLCKKQQGIYKSQIRVENLKVQQRDLEDLLESIKAGKEGLLPWKKVGNVKNT